MGKPLQLPRLYAIIDAAMFAREKDAALAMARFAEHLIAGGATVIQLRNKLRDKRGSAPVLLAQARELRRVADGTTLIMNDRADLCVAAGFNGVHVGQDDLSAEGARTVVGGERFVGVSTHNAEQLTAADKTDANYVAIGPVFATSTKDRHDPTVGLDGVRRARAGTRKPLVAIGGITRANCRAVIEAGADCVAVVSDLADRPRAAVEEFFRLMA
jgi:thiamine-phosphate pyrophosphorylase